MIYSRNGKTVNEAKVDRKREPWGEKSLKKKGVRPCEAIENFGLYPKISGKPVMSFKQSDRIQAIV